MEQKNRKDILGTGAVLGDMALLTGGQVRTTVTCETSVQVGSIGVLHFCLCLNCIYVGPFV